jgi:hypothetical protein
MMSLRERLEIPLSKKKLMMALIVSVGFAVGGVFMLLNPALVDDPILATPGLTFFTGLVSVPIFGMIAVYLTRKLMDKTPGLLVDTIGVVDNSGIVSIGPVPWNDVERISLEEENRRVFLVIVLKNPQDYIAKQTNVFKRKLMRMNNRMYETPFLISASTLKVSNEELLQILTDYLGASRV